MIKGNILFKEKEKMLQQKTPNPKPHKNPNHPNQTYSQALKCLWKRQPFSIWSLLIKFTPIVRRVLADVTSEPVVTVIENLWNWIKFIKNK